MMCFRLPISASDVKAESLNSLWPTTGHLNVRRGYPGMQQKGPPHPRQQQRSLARARRDPSAEGFTVTSVDRAERVQLPR